MKKIYNTTYAVDVTYADAWLKQVQEKYLPALMRCPLVRQAHLIRVPQVDGMSEDARTYTIQIYFDSQIDIEMFLARHHADALQVFEARAWEYAHSFSLSLDIISHHTR